MENENDYFEDDNNDDGKKTPAAIYTRHVLSTFTATFISSTYVVYTTVISIFIVEEMEAQVGEVPCLR